MTTPRDEQRPTDAPDATTDLAAGSLEGESADSATAEHAEQAEQAGASRPDLRQRLADRARGTSRPVRWTAAALLALLLAFGIGAAGFALGNEGGGGHHGGGHDGRGDHGERRNDGGSSDDQASTDYSDSDATTDSTTDEDQADPGDSGTSETPSPSSAPSE